MQVFRHNYTRKQKVVVRCLHLYHESKMSANVDRYRFVGFFCFLDFFCWFFVVFLGGNSDTTKIVDIGDVIF